MNATTENMMTLVKLGDTNGIVKNLVFHIAAFLVNVCTWVEKWRKEQIYLKHKQLHFII